MSKQQRSLGNLSSMMSSSESQFQTTTPEERIEALERRVRTLEILLNDVMMQLDKPYKHAPDHKTKSNGKPASKQPSKAKPDDKPLHKKKAPTEASQHPQKVKPNGTQSAEKPKMKKKYPDNVEDFKKMMSDSKKRSSAEMHELLPDMSKSTFDKIRKHLMRSNFLCFDANEDNSKRLYFMNPNFRYIELSDAEKASKKDAKHKAHIARLEAVEAKRSLAKENMKEIVSDGVKRTETQMREAVPELSKTLFRKLIPELEVKDDGNENRDERLYFIDKS